MTPYRVLLVLRSSPSRFIPLAQRLEAFLQGQLGDARRVSVVTAAQDMMQNWGRTSGDWAKWAEDVGAGQRYSDAQPRYHALVVADPKVGRVVSVAITAALREGRTRVFSWDVATALKWLKEPEGEFPEVELRRVRGIAHPDIDALLDEHRDHMGRSDTGKAFKVWKQGSTLVFE